MALGFDDVLLAAAVGGGFGLANSIVDVVVASMNRKVQTDIARKRAAEIQRQLRATMAELHELDEDVLDESDPIEDRGYI